MKIGSMDIDGSLGRRYHASAMKWFCACCNVYKGLGSIGVLVIIGNDSLTLHDRPGLANQAEECRDWLYIRIKSRVSRVGGLDVFVVFRQAHRDRHFLSSIPGLEGSAIWQSNCHAKLNSNADDRAEAVFHIVRGCEAWTRCLRWCDIREFR